MRYGLGGVLYKCGYCTRMMVLYLQYSLLYSLLLTLVLPGCLCLRCLVCRGTRRWSVGPDYKNINSQRINFELDHRRCNRFEEIECDRDQDICVTVQQKMPGHSYWTLMGCSRSDNPMLQFPEKSRDCEMVREETREITYDDDNFGRRKIIQGKAEQHICICRTDYCNAATVVSFSSTVAAVLISWICFVVNNYRLT